MLLQMAWLNSFLWLSSIPLRRRQWHPTPVLLPGKSHGRRSLMGCSPWGLEESDMTERLHFHFSLLCIGEGNGNPLQCSCLENPRDRGAWWAAVYRVAPSQTQLKRLSSSSSTASFWIQQMGLLDHMVTLFFVFWGTSRMFSIVVAPLIFPSECRKVPFCHTLFNICYF